MPNANGRLRSDAGEMPRASLIVIGGIFMYMQAYMFLLSNVDVWMTF